MDLEVEVGRLQAKMAGWPLTWAESGVLAGEEVCLAVGTADDLQCGADV